MRSYELMFAGVAADFILSQPKRRQKKVMDLAYRLAGNAEPPSDYTLKDGEGGPLNMFCSKVFSSPTGWITRDAR
jgi:hypothetical protein